jgi:putative heme-binding domain-containing protein
MSLGQSLVHQSQAVRSAAVAVVKAGGLKEFDKTLLNLSRQQSLPAELRIAALECLAGRQRVDADSFILLTAHLSDKAEPLVRLAAARTLGASTLDAEQLRKLADSFPGAGTLVLRLLLPAFARSADPKVGRALAEALRHASGAEALAAAELDRALQKYPSEVQKLARPLQEKLAARQQQQAAYLASLQADLGKHKGRADLGRFVFFSPKVGCATCHRAENKGGQIGPDLSRIGQFRNKDEILESIVFPNLTIAPEYRTYNIVTGDGRVVTGLITWETPEALFVRTTQLDEVRIARKDVEELAPTNVSLMPEGLERTLNREELRDLVEFLIRQK